MIEPAARRPGALDLMGIGVHPVGSAAILDFCRQTIDSGRQSVVLHLNVHGANLAARRPWLRAFLNEAQLVFCDGDGIRLGLRLLGLDPPPKVTYNVWIWELAAWCAAGRRSLFLLGGRPGVAATAAENLRARSPQLTVAGHHHGYFEKSGAESDAVVETINSARPDVLLVCFGWPAQEAWVREVRARLEVPVILTGGAAIDYAAGIIRQTPRWMARLHLEWLYRLIQEPRRLFVRYVIGNPLFLLRVLRAMMTRQRRPP
jgi:N-acetylglucosaminyldiphosphoundecaprenol N-acetyl-beta-D-mannosaminyltransferase